MFVKILSVHTAKSASHTTGCCHICQDSDCGAASSNQPSMAWRLNITGAAGLQDEVGKPEVGHLESRHAVSDKLSAAQLLSMAKSNHVMPSSADATAQPSNVSPALKHNRPAGLSFLPNHLMMLFCVS